MNASSKFDAKVYQYNKIEINLEYQ